MPVLAASPRLEGRRDHRQPSPAGIRAVEIRISPIHQGATDLLTVYFLTGFRLTPTALIGHHRVDCIFVGPVRRGSFEPRWIVSRLDQDPANDLHLHERAVFYYSMGGCCSGSSISVRRIAGRIVHGLLGHDVQSYSIRQRVGRKPARRTETVMKGSTHDRPKNRVEGCEVMPAAILTTASRCGATPTGS